MELRIRTFSLIHPCQERDKDEVGVVECVLRAFFEFVLYRFGRQLLIHRHGTEVGDDTEDAFGLLAFEAAILRIALRRSLLRLGSSNRR